MDQRGICRQLDIARENMFTQKILLMRGGTGITCPASHQQTNFLIDF